MDYLKKLSDQLGGQIRSQNHLNPNIDSKSVRALVVKNYKTFTVQVDEYANLLMLGIKINSDLAFSINNPDTIFNFETPINLENFSYQIYVSDDFHHISKNKYFVSFWKGLNDQLTKLKLNRNESVFFYKNWIYYALTPNRDLFVVLNDIIDLINSNIDIFKKHFKQTIFDKNIPDSLKHLVPLLKKWSIADDVEREELIKETGRRQKEKLIVTVYPFMGEINSFLDSFKDQPLSEEAILLGNLAELVSELKNDA